VGAWLWWWIRHENAVLFGGAGTDALVREGIDTQTGILRAEVGEGHGASRLDLAASLLKDYAKAIETHSTASR
jgi:hypothetical protein